MNRKKSYTHCDASEDDVKSLFVENLSFKQHYWGQGSSKLS